MSPRTVTPAAAKHLVECDAADCWTCGKVTREDLAATIASEPERIAAAVAAEADRIYRAATAGLDDYLAADKALLDALGRGEVRDEYHPLILARMRRLDYLRDLLAPVTQ